MIKIDNKFNLNDRAFILIKGNIIHVLITAVHACYDYDGMSIFYHVKADTEASNKLLSEQYGLFDEDKLYTSIEDIITRIPIL